MKQPWRQRVLHWECLFQAAECIAGIWARPGSVHCSARRSSSTSVERRDTHSRWQALVRLTGSATAMTARICFSTRLSQ